MYNTNGNGMDTGSTCSQRGISNTEIYECETHNRHTSIVHSLRSGVIGPISRSCKLRIREITAGRKLLRVRWSCVCVLVLRYSKVL